MDGLVDRPLSLSLDDLRAMPTIERVVTLSCISNPVGGPLVGNARWTGVTTASLLELARPQPRATWVLVQAADGYHESFPIDMLRADGPMVAFGMDGFTLPRRHGFAARLLVPGHDGMKNVKWLTRLTLSDAPAAGVLGPARLGLRGHRPHGVPHRHPHRPCHRHLPVHRRRPWPGPAPAHPAGRGVDRRR
ncbi:MAG: molybdopterin-dependent oxidoreductase [Nocardioidaceae bacterium]|nr:molybdopterin-dependent oxidoreductase [Nocardioidaceae bacterium]